MTLVNNNLNKEWTEKLQSLSPEVREMFLKYSGPLIQLGIDLRFNRGSLISTTQGAKKSQNP